MPKFDVTLHTEVVALICESDRFTPEGWRVWLQPTLDAPTLNAIIWQGSPHDFAANLVITLTHEQLVAALADLHSEDRGIGWRARVGALCHRINEQTYKQIIDES